jgi:hypothetical protein
MNLLKVSLENYDMMQVNLGDILFARVELQLVQIITQLIDFGKAW